jgi:hypothetical protein
MFGTHMLWTPGDMTFGRPLMTWWHRLVILLEGGQPQHLLRAQRRTPRDSDFQQTIDDMVAQVPLMHAIGGATAAKLPVMHNN